MSEARKVSNSEAVTFGECQRKWLYQYKYGLENVSGNISFDRGTAVHTVMETFFRALMEGADYDVAVKLSNKKHMELAVEHMGTDLGKAILSMAPMLKAFFYHKREEILTWEILGVELELEARLTDEVILAGRIDLLIRKVSGAFKGQTIPVDHKTAYNFWSEAEMEINAQGPLYSHLVKFNFPDRVVQNVFFNNIRTRLVQDTEELSKIQVMAVPKSLRNAMVDNHIKLATQVVKWHEMSMDEAKAQATRSPNPYVCKGCSMRKLCRAELDGIPTEDIIKNEYRRNSYLYEQE